jgi:hypothetical protein
MKLWRRVWHQSASLNARLADSWAVCAWCVPSAQESREIDRYIGKVANALTPP